MSLLTACDKAPEASAPVRLPPGLAAQDYPPRGWTWSEVPGPVAHRYGVGSPAVAMRAQVLIVPARAPAEAWFAVANRLIERGYGVWVLDPLPSPPDAAAVRSMIDAVIRPGETRRLAVLGEAEGAQAVLAAGERPDLVLLWKPKLAVPPEGLTGWAIKLGLGRVRDPRAPVWRQGQPAGDPVAAAWMAANPSLRPPIRDFVQQAKARQIALEAQGPSMRSRIKGQVRIAPTGDAKAVCAGFKDCASIADGVEAAADALDALTAADTPSAPPVRKAAARKARGT